MTTINTNCPNCNEPISMEIAENDFSRQIMNWLPAVHCETCYGIKRSQGVTAERIKSITENIRNSSGNLEQISKLEGALKAQYSSAKMLREKLEARSGTTRVKQSVDSSDENRLPW